MDIQLVKNEAIDKTKWNSCVHYATNGNIFGYKWYLDSVSKGWDALIEGDYESVLPLFQTSSAPASYHQALIGEGGIYSIHLLSQKRIEAFIEAVPATYKNFGIQFKKGIQLPANTNFEISQKRNYSLYLQSPYDTIQNNYSEALKAALENAKQYHLKPITNLKPEKIAALFKDNVAKSKASEAVFHAYQRIMYNALHRGWGFASGIVNEKDTLLAAAFFIISHGKILSLLTPQTKEGKAQCARDLLFDYFIRNNAGRPLILDFNTNDDYPKNFGALQKNLQHLSRKSKKWWKVF